MKVTSKIRACCILCCKEYPTYATEKHEDSVIHQFHVINNLIFRDGKNRPSPYIPKFTFTGDDEYDEVERQKHNSRTTDLRLYEEQGINMFEIRSGIKMFTMRNGICNNRPRTNLSVPIPVIEQEVRDQTG